MSTRLRVLLVEDNPDDAALVTRALERGGYPSDVTRVEERAEMEAALAKGPWDLVIADHSLPRFSSHAALETLRAVDEDVGCVIVSGSLGEEAAVQAMRAGADDYVLKDRLGALPGAVERTFRTAQARRDRRRAEGRYRRLVESAPDGVVTVDRVGTITSVNPAFEAMAGMPGAAVVGHHFRKFLHPDDAVEMVAGFEGALSVDTPTLARVRVLNGGGLYFHAELTVARLREGGEVVGLFGIFRDITERRAMERELRRSEAHLRTLVESAPDGIFSLNVNGELTSANPALRQMMGEGRPPIGSHFRDIIHADDLARAHDIFSRRLRGEEVPPYELRLLRANGEALAVEITSSALREGNKVTGSLGIVRDISRRRAAEAEQARLQAAIQAAAMDWTATFDAVPMTIVLLDGDLCIRRLNRSAQEAMGASFRDLVDRPLAEIPGAPWARAVVLAAKVRSTGTAMVDQLEEPGTGRTWSILLAPMAASEDHPLVLIARDTTDLAQLQRTLAHERTMAALGALVAGVAHEVRNPLFAISATLDAFEARFGKEPDFTRYTSNLRPEVQRLSALMRDLLEYGRPSVLQPVLTDLTPVVREAAARSEPPAAPRGVRIELVAADGLPAVQHDPARMGQVIQNLLDNALVHAPDGSRITVRLSTLQTGGRSWYRLAVEDEGSGFRVDDLPHVFEPFYSRRRGGTGLGLSIVERLVGQHGGLVTAENRAEGGARVTILLPLA
ncbi:MAG TPA: PAS domain S-box protein [Gemmatimonadales bacterium]|jgi:PAS domain S-box-containing protein|nr:PAS domain S-box protein [Gemmatimonadales bacterium]